MDKISIIVPVYNVEKYLEKCINSIIIQTFKNLEIILIDDGSNDNSGKICDEFAKKDTRIKVIHQINQGLSKARNVGIETATGKYIGFIDSDDYVDNRMYEILYDNIIKYDADISVCAYEKISENDAKIDNIKKDESSGTMLMTREEALKELLLEHERIENYVTNKLYKKNLFTNIRFPVNRKFEDLGIMYYLFDKSKRIVFSNYVGYMYLQRNNSITGNIKIEDIKDEMYMVKERYDYLIKKYKCLKKELLLNRACYALIFHVNYAKLGEYKIYNDVDIIDEYDFYKNYIKTYTIKDILKMNKTTYKFFAILLEYTNRKIFYNICYILNKIKKIISRNKDKRKI